MSNMVLRDASASKNLANLDRTIFENFFFLVVDTSQYYTFICFTFSMGDGSALLMESIMDQKVGFFEITLNDVSETGLAIQDK